MRKANAIRRIHVKRLRLSRRRDAGRRVTNMANTHIAGQSQHVLALEHILHKTIVLMHAKCSIVIGHDARSVLTTMLKHYQCIIDGLIYRAVTDDSYYAAHVKIPLLKSAPVFRTEF
jgi:hypothetical protein